MNTNPTSTARPLPPEAELRQAVLRRDASYDGLFIVGVRSTGIFCRPSCPARKPLAKNMEYYRGPSEALLAGYRPCKRCRPMDANGRPTDWVQRLFAMVEENPTRRWADWQLTETGINPSRARRYFQQNYGMTFQAYHRARRMGLALAQVRAGADLNGVGLSSGYDSNSGFRDAFARIFGCPPGAGRTMTHAVTTRIETPLGVMVAVAVEDGLCLLEFADRPALERQLRVLRKRLDCVITPGTNSHLLAIQKQLARYFGGDLIDFDVPMVTPGTLFQETVWRGLGRIAYGRTCSYSQLATAIGREGACRAVGRANGDNRISIVIPCHRVVQNDGNLRGYGGGLWRKKYLLDLEAQHQPSSHP